MAAVPTVSVIIPVYNDTERLRACLVALDEQDYPHDRLEVVVSDNGSEDSLVPVVADRPRVRVVHEPGPGSYTARNRALRHARGEVLAFTDSDCLPAPGWISAAVRALIHSRSTVVAGKVVVFAADARSPHPVEAYELVKAFPQERYARHSGFAATANMVTTRTVVDAVGDFNAALRSGGDREWGARAREAGCQVVFAEDAVVRHPARRSWRELWVKLERVHAGDRDLRAARGEPLATRGETWRGLVPPLGAVQRVRSDSRLPSLRGKTGYVAAEFFVRYAGTYHRLRAARRTASPR